MIDIDKNPEIEPERDKEREQESQLEEPQESPQCENPIEQWAEVLGMEIDAEKLKKPVTPPPYSPTTPPEVQMPPEMPMQQVVPIAPLSPIPPLPPSQRPEMPPTNMVWAIVSTLLCCMPAGVVAIIYASQVASKFYAGDVLGAKKASDRAAIWVIASVVLGIVGGALYLPVLLLQ